MSRVARLFGSGRRTSETAAPAQVAAWEEGRANEVGFWVDYLSTKGSKWPEDFTARLDPDLPLQEYLRARLGHVDAGSEVRILDCGAGPFTVVGKRWEGRAVTVTAVDALADEYNAALDGDGIVPPVRTQRAEVERLDSMFPANSFDLVYMRNALDHSYDPMEGIRQMARAVKVGCVVLLEHYVDEAESAGYDGLHQWNLRPEHDGSLVLWNRRARLVVNELLPNVAIECAKGEGRWFSADIRKLADAPSGRGSGWRSRRTQSPTAA
jgi:SAM-dependent methyltransferase